MVGLRTDDQVDHRGAAHDLLALGLGHAAGDGDLQGAAARGAALLHLADAAQLGIDLLGGLLTDVAGVQHHQVRVVRLGGQGVAQRAQDIGHALAVVDVHLTAVGLDVEPLLRRLAHRRAL